MIIIMLETRPQGGFPGDIGTQEKSPNLGMANHQSIKADRNNSGLIPV